MKYKCSNCKEDWDFIPEDYEDISGYPVKCPHCIMPVWQMISDVYKEEGLLEVIRMLYLRYI